MLSLANIHSGELLYKSLTNNITTFLLQEFQPQMGIYQETQFHPTKAGRSNGTVNPKRLSVVVDATPGFLLYTVWHSSHGCWYAVRIGDLHFKPLECRDNGAKRVSYQKGAGPLSLPGTPLSDARGIGWIQCPYRQIHYPLFTFSSWTLFPPPHLLKKACFCPLYSCCYINSTGYPDWRL